jgi:hypothetical protein
VTTTNSAGEAEQVGDRRAQPAGGRAGVEVGLDHDLAAGEVQAPANRSSAATSALRTAGLVTGTFASSAFTSAVNAMACASLTLSQTSASGPRPGGSRRGVACRRGRHVGVMTSSAPSEAA